MDSFLPSSFFGIIPSLQDSRIRLPAGGVTIRDAPPSAARAVPVALSPTARAPAPAARNSRRPSDKFRLHPDSFAMTIPLFQHLIACPFTPTTRRGPVYRPQRTISSRAQARNPQDAQEDGESDAFLLALLGVARYHHGCRRRRIGCWECKRHTILIYVLNRGGHGVAKSGGWPLGRNRDTRVGTCPYTARDSLRFRFYADCIIIVRRIREALAETTCCSQVFIRLMAQGPSVCAEARHRSRIASCADADRVYDIADHAWCVLG